MKMKLSQREAAKRMNFSHNMLNRYEKGVRLMEMSADKAAVLAEFFRWDLKKMLRAMKAEASAQERKSK